MYESKIMKSYLRLIDVIETFINRINKTTLNFMMIFINFIRNRLRANEQIPN